MIVIYHTQKNTPFVWASDLHKLLEINISLTIWFQRMIEYGFIEGQDYSRHNKFVNSANGIKEAVFDWAVQIDMAKHIAMIQRTDVGKSMRQYLLDLDKQVTDGTMLSGKQLSALFDICRVLGFFTVQNFFQKKHFEAFNRPKEWWDYRASLIGYKKGDLREIMSDLGLKYKSAKQAIFKVDKYELIRIASIDMFIAIGKDPKYAQNMANTVMNIAKEIQPDIYNDEGMEIDFKSVKEKETIKNITSVSKPDNMLKLF